MDQVGDPLATIVIALYQLNAALQQMYQTGRSRSLAEECAPWTYKGRFLCRLENSPRPEP